MESKQLKYFFSRALRLLGILLFLFILSRIDRTEILQWFSLLNVPTLLAISCIVFLIYLTKAIRWHMLVQAAGVHPTFTDSWKLYNIGIFHGSITPGRTGELSKCLALKRLGVPHDVGISLVIIDRLLDLLAVMITAIFAVGFFFGSTWSFAGTLSLLLGAAVFLFLLKKTIVRRFTALHALFRRMFVPHIFLTIIGMTVLGWLISFTWWITIARGVGMTISPIAIIAAMSIACLFAILPISINGFGTRDAVVVFLLQPFGVPPSQAVALACIIFLLLLLSSGLGGFYWIFSPSKQTLS